VRSRRSREICDSARPLLKRSRGLQSCSSLLPFFQQRHCCAQEDWIVYVLPSARRAKPKLTSFCSRQAVVMPTIFRTDLSETMWCAASAFATSDSRSLSPC
jgi:hypothetical protein